MIPPYLLNANGTFFTETNPLGAFREPTKTLTVIGTSRVRADMTGESRDVLDGSFEQRQRVFRVVVNDTPPTLTTKTWVEIVSDYNEFTFLAQISSIQYSGLGNNHAELVVVEQPPMAATPNGQRQYAGLEIRR